jgi:hypothetical protein
MRKFKGNINGTVYTNEKEFNKALIEWDGVKDITVSYKYISVPDVNDESKQIDNNICNDCNNLVAERDYIKNISNKKDVELDSNLINKLNNASNKSEINLNVCNKINDFDNKISDNLLRINDLKSDYKKLDEKIKLINSQIKTLDDANNNYYLNKEYYTNIKNLMNSHDTQKESCEKCSCDECNCNDKKLIPSLKDIYSMTPQELAKYLKKNNIYNLADLVEFFIKNC